MSRILAFIVLIAIIPVAFAQPAKDAKKRKPTITVGRDTTFIDGPIDKDGYPDYEAALNEKLREGVTAENNANVLLFKAFGPHPEGANIPDAFFKWMKIKAPPEKGDYFLNARMYFRERFKDDAPFSKKVTDFEDEMYKLTNRPWTAKQHPEVAAWLKRNDKPLAVAIEATKRSRYYYPLVSSSPDGRQQTLIGALIPGIQKTREFATALSARAMLRLGEKKYDDAWQDLLACHRLGRLVGQGGTLIESLVGIALDRVASDADLAFIEHAKLDSKQLKKCLADLQKLPPMPPIAEKVAVAERFIFLQIVILLDRDGVEMLDGLSGGKPPVKLSVNELARTANWDIALRAGNQAYNRMAAIMRLKDQKLRVKHLNDFDMDLKTLRVNTTGAGGIAKSLLASKNLSDAQGKIIGDILVCLMVPAVSKVQQASDRAEQTQNNLHIAFALAAYNRDNGKYPKELNALAPKYMETIPNDLFSGKELYYRPEANGYLLYSVGPNGRDDGGRSYDDDPPGDDLPVRMPRAK